MMPTRLQVSVEISDGQAESFPYIFDQDRIVIGRGAGADIRIPHPAVSERHATISRNGPNHFVTDENSTNGTYVNQDQLVAGRAKPLAAQHIISIAHFRISFQPFTATSERTSAERTAELARRMVREVFGKANAMDQPNISILNGPNAGTALPLPAPPAHWVVGRADTCDLVIDDADASREHAEIIRDLDGALLRDLDSKNGILVNGKPFKEKRLREGDLIVVGLTEFAYSDPADRKLREILGAPDMVLPKPQVSDLPRTRPERDITKANSITPIESQKTQYTDWAIYALSTLVLCASIIGLYILFRAR